MKHFMSLLKSFFVIRGIQRPENGRALLDYLSEGLISFDRDLRLTYINRTGAKFLGVSAGELLGKKIWEAFPEVTGSVFLETYQRALEQNVSMTVEAASVRRPGKWIRAKAYPGPEGLAVFFQDTTNDRLARRALEESEERFRSTFTQASVGIAHVGLRGDWLRVNRRICEILGHDRESLLRSRFHEIVAEHYFEEIGEESQRLLEGSTSNLTAEIVCNRRDGSRGWVQVTVSVARGTEGDAKYFIVVMQDITSRKEAEASLSESEERYRSLVESSPDIIVVHSGGQIFYINQVGAEALGAESPHELEGCSLLEFLDQDFKQIVVSNQQIRTPIQGSLHTQSGYSRAVELVARPIVYRGQQACQLILRDLTEKRQAELELQEATRTITALVSASSAAICMLDRNGRITLWNPAAEQMFGWKEREVLGTNLPTVPGSSGSEPLANALAGEIQKAVELRRQRKDGSFVDVSASAAPLRNASGEIIGAVGVAIDVTEQKELEAQLRQAQKMEAVGRLAGGVAHDFNNILTIIHGNAVLLRQEHGDRSSTEVEEVLLATERATELTRQLLHFSRREVVQPQVVDLNATIKGTERMLQRLIGEDIRLETAFSTDVGSVWTDPGHIHQILMNLAVNARDAMPEGGRLMVRTRVVTSSRPLQEHPNRISEGDYYVLSISDSGSGMNKATLARAFEPFFTTKQAGKGTGLGLSTVYGIIQQAGGGIAVQSEVGEGTTFNVYLPQFHGAETSRSPDNVALEDLGGEATVFLVEDEASVRALAAKILRRYGYGVMTAAGGEEALRLLESHTGSIDLLLTDVVMPGMGGRKLAEEVHRILPGTKIMFMTGYTEDEILRRGIRQASVGFLEKPFSPAELLRKVRESLLDDHPSRDVGAV